MNKLKNWICMTSINPPTEAVSQFSEVADWGLVVVGDKKTPVDWHKENVTYIPVSSQNKLGYRIVEKLPYNHYSRKMIAYLYALSKGASRIADSDDDNLPMKKWSGMGLVEDVRFVRSENGYANVYELFTDKLIWPRGFPLNKINEIHKYKVSTGPVDLSKIGIIQGLVDNDPDVDAIYRLLFGDATKFNDNLPVLLEKYTMCPFNSQNTIFVSDVVELMYLPAYVSFRFTDILRGMVAKPILDANGYYLVFTPPTAIQIRNDHNLLKDFEHEVPFYLNAEKVYETVGAVVSENMSIGQNLYKAYLALEKQSIVNKLEVDLLELWLKDVDEIKKCQEKVNQF